MAARQPVWGIDVGQCSLKAVKLQAAGDKVELLGFDLVEHSQFLSLAESDAGDIVRSTIRTFAERNDLSNCQIVVSVPGQQTLTRFTKMPPVDKKKIPDMVQYEASQQIPFDMDEVVWDYQVMTEGEAAEFEVGIFAIRKELIRNYLQQFTSQKVEPVMVQTSPMASYNAARFELDLPEGETYVLLDMGALATDLIVMEGKRIWARPVPIGGNRFTESLVSAFKVPFAKAEKLKRTAATSKYARQIFQAMRPVFADLVSEVQRSIGYYTSTHRESHITRIIGMGNAFKLPGLQKFLQQNVQMKVDKFPGFSRMVPVANQKHDEFEENQMSLGVAYGLALQGLDLAAVNSNLLPLEVRRTLLWQKKQPWFIGAAASLAAAAGIMFIGNVMASSEVQSARGGVEPGQLRAANFSQVDAAMAALNPSGTATPVQRAMQVAGAAKYLKSEYAKYTGGSKEAGTLVTLAKFPQNNVFVPRILDAIHRAFEEAVPPDIRNTKSPEDYLRVASRIKRAERKELWVRQIQMRYSDDPGQEFRNAFGESKTARGKPGWAILVNGITTEPTPATWIEENLKRILLELGCEPGKGFYIDTVTLSKVTERSKDSKLVSEGSAFSGASEGGGDGGGRRGGGPPRGGGRPGSDGRDDRRDLSGGPIVGGPFGGGPSGPRGGSSVRDDLRKLSEELAKKDPLTKESIDRDYAFELQIVVRKDEPPKDRIPEKFKEPKPDTAGGGTPPKS
ncbi:MAG: type IV pilus assembly protein PilM [Phycisphaerae bacterium]|nr:type IV pilus assembly protein PilM [Phycisphaerae bacterium]